MNPHRDLATLEQTKRLPELNGNGKGDGIVKFDAYRSAQRAMRGRYAMAITLGLLGAVLGAAAGWKLVAPTYRSEGLLRIAPTLPSVMADRSESVPIAMFDAYMRTQQQVLASRRTIDLAITLPSWTSSRMPQTQTAADELASHLTVEHPNGADYLRPMVVETSPAAAAAGVRAVIDAYVQIYHSHDNRYERMRLDALNTHKNDLDDQLAANQVKLDAAVHEFGTANLAAQYDALASQADGLQRKLAELTLALAAREVDEKPQKVTGTTDNPHPAENGGPSPSADELAMAAERLSACLARRGRVTDQIEQFKRLNYLDNHPYMIRLRAELAVVQGELEQAANDFRQLQARRSPVAAVIGENSALAAQPVESLQAEQKRVGELLDQTKQKAVAMGVRQRQLDEVREDAQRLKTELAKVQAKIEQLVLDSTLGSNLQVLSNGEVPVKPLRDLRPIGATAGGLGGALIPLALVMLRGLLFRRYRYSDETTDASRVALLGIVPSLPETLTNAEQAAEAAQCVHQIRVRLQSQRPVGESSIYMITSSAPGAGKTSLVMALGLSYAGSGSRTLIVDCDLIGQQLTSGLEGAKLTGLHEALQEGTVRGHAREALPGLWYLTVGQVRAGGAWSVSPAALRRLLADARQHFDVVLIDTGPALSSVEAAVVAPEADGVVFAIARGEHRPAVERAMELLRSVGGKIAGVVFNRALSKDFYKVSFGQSSRPVSSRYGTSVTPIPAEDEGSAFGPLVRSVALSMPSGARA